MRTWAFGREGHVPAAVNPFEHEELAGLRTRAQARPHPLDSLPVIVITRGQPEEAGPDAGLLEEEHHQDLTAIAARSRRGRIIVAPNSGHHVQLDEPEVVINAIRDVVQLVRQSR